MLTGTFITITCSREHLLLLNAHRNIYYYYMLTGTFTTIKCTREYIFVNTSQLVTSDDIWRPLQSTEGCPYIETMSVRLPVAWYWCLNHCVFVNSISESLIEMRLLITDFQPHRPPHSNFALPKFLK
jgi:hypothetical protein